MDVIFDAKNLKHLRQVVKDAIGLDLSSDELYVCATSLVRFACAKELRMRALQGGKNGGVKL